MANMSNKFTSNKFQVKENRLKMYLMLNLQSCDSRVRAQKVVKKSIYVKLVPYFFLYREEIVAHTNIHLFLKCNLFCLKSQAWREKKKAKKFSRNWGAESDRDSGEQSTISTRLKSGPDLARPIRFSISFSLGLQRSVNFYKVPLTVFLSSRSKQKVNFS